MSNSSPDTSGSTKTVAATLLRPDNEFMVSLAEIDADEDPKEANDLLDRACVVITDLANQVVALQQPSEPEVYLARYGVNHNHGPHDPLLELMPDGYWTPWHIADQALRTKPAPAGEPVADTNERVSDQRLAELLHIATFSAFKASAMYELALALTELQQLRLTTKVPITAAAALDAIKAQMLKDPAFAWTWHCGLAMSIKDNLGANHGDANRAAAAFMRLAFEVDTSRQPETKDGNDNG